MRREPDWWEKARLILLVVVGLLFLVAIGYFLIHAGYSFDWAGFNEYTQVTTAHTISGPSAGTVVRTEVSQPAKTLWDWLQLAGVVAIPLVVYIGTILFTRQQSRAADDQQRETALQSYFDKMSDLLLHEELHISPVDSEVRNIARARTLTVLRGLDPVRKGLLLRFLCESLLIANDVRDDIINLSGADLSGADLRGANLKKVDLHEADLSNADLSFADLSEANLSKAVLDRARLERAILNNANLSEARLIRVTLTNARLCGANLSKAKLFGSDLRAAELGDQLDTATNLDRADLRGADLSGKRLLLFGRPGSGAGLHGANMHRVDLRGADLHRTDLREVDLSEADLRSTNLRPAILSGAVLDRADLRGAKYYSEQLEEVASHSDIILK